MKRDYDYRLVASPIGERFSERKNELLEAGYAPVTELNAKRSGCPEEGVVFWQEFRKFVGKV